MVRTSQPTTTGESTQLVHEHAMSSSPTTRAECSGGSSESGLQPQVAGLRDNKSMRNESTCVTVSERAQQATCHPKQTKTGALCCSSKPQCLERDTSPICIRPPSELEEACGSCCGARSGNGRGATSASASSVEAGGSGSWSTSQPVSTSVSSQESTGSSEDYQEGAEARRIERLVAMFRFWCPSSDMRQEENSRPPTPSTYLDSQNHHRCLQYEAYPHSATSMFALQTPSAMHSFTHLYRPNTRQQPRSRDSSVADTEPASGRSIWRYLEIPLVLGCVIFLIVVWIRQISVLVINNTAIMLIILGAILIIISCITFWVLHTHKNASIAGGALARVASDTCPHHGGQLIDYSSALEHVTANRLDGMGGARVKCCHVAVIDCQPPDYYSALRDSSPVALYKQQQHLLLGADFWPNEKRRVSVMEGEEEPSTSSHNSSSGDHSLPVADTTGQSPPPSYEGLGHMYRCV